eukprot:gene18673-26406_t
MASQVWRHGRITDRKNERAGSRECSPEEDAPDGRG